MRIPCTCGCGLQVTYTTKINHLNGRGKTSLRARVLEEIELLKPSTSQQPVLLRDHPEKKRSNRSSDQIGKRKRLKVAEHEVDQIPEISLREDADPMGSLSVRNEESEILPSQAYTESMESSPTLVLNQVPEFSIQMHTEPTESPPVSVPNQLPEFPIQMHTEPTESPPVSVPNQLPEFPIQMHTEPTESPPVSASGLLPTPVPNQVPRAQTPPVQSSTNPIESSPTLIPNQIPDYLPFPQADAGPDELLPVPEPNSGIGDGSADALSSTRRSNRIAERTRDVAERRWGGRHLQDEIPRSDSGGGGYRSEDEEDIDVAMIGNEDREDEVSEDEVSEDEDDDDPFAESDIAGISAWDQLGEGFEREASSIGMFFAQ